MIKMIKNKQGTEFYTQQKLVGSDFSHVEQTLTYQTLIFMHNKLPNEQFSCSLKILAGIEY